MSLGRADRGEAPAGDGEGLRPRRARVHRVDLGIDDDEIGIRSAGSRCLSRGWRGLGAGQPWRAGQGGKRHAGDVR